MAHLIEVFSELFRSYGYASTSPHEVEGRSGRRWPARLLLEKDSRRLAVLTWLEAQPLPETLVESARELVRDGASDGALVLSLGPVGEALAVRGASERVQVWDLLRITQELGTAVLHETCPGLWDRQDPLTAPRASRILAHVRQAVLQQAPTQPLPAPAAPTSPEPTPSPPSTPTVQATLPTTVPPPSVPSALPSSAPAPALADAPPPAAPSPAVPAAAERAAGEFALPPAFGVLDGFVSQPVITQPAPQTPPASPTTPEPRTDGRKIVRVQVNKSLALSLVKGKLRHVERVFLRLVPYYVYDFEAHLLLEGSLDAEVRKGRMGVDAALKRVQEWAQPLDVGELPREGVDVDEKKVRLTEPEARKALLGELQGFVTRDVTMQEDDSEWSVVVRKKVTLAEDEIRLNPLGVFWVPLWRLTGKEGSVEINASTGEVVFEELLQPRADAQLI